MPKEIARMYVMKIKTRSIQVKFILQNDFTLGVFIRNWEQYQRIMYICIILQIIIKHSSYIMLRIFTVRTSRFCFASPKTIKGFQIYKLTYLIESPPKLNASAYALFVKNESAGKKIKTFGDKSIQMSQKWHKSPQIQDKFKKLSEENMKSYIQKKEQYQKKFVIPFKRLSYVNILMKKLSPAVKQQLESKGKQQAKSINIYGENLAKKLKALKPEEIQAVKKQTQMITSERNAIISQYKFPPLKHKSLRSYILKHSSPKEQRGPTYKKDQQNAYNQLLKKWRAEVQEWLKKTQFKITADEFITLYENALTAEKIRKSKIQNQDSNDGN